MNIKDLFSNESKVPSYMPPHNSRLYLLSFLLLQRLAQRKTKQKDDIGDSLH
ncbi:hypothetical protein BN132_541 [Cronobacter turicensis 564]|nr:hypothetical protein BN132_541 [Cronobacter turicensis 564]